MKNHAEMILENFRYLIDEFGFKILREEFDSATLGNAIVVFGSKTTGIEIVIDRNQALMSIGDIVDPRNKWFEFFDVVNYFASEKGKSYIFPEKTVDNTWNEVLDTQMKRLADILKKDCLPLLKGEPLVKTEIQKIKDNRVAELYRAFHLPTDNPGSN